MSIVFNFCISDAISRLRRETYNHPKLRERINKAMQEGLNARTTLFEDTRGEDIVIIRDVAELIGFLASETGILLHGAYNQEDIDKLCDILRHKLEERRALVVGEKKESVIVDTAGKQIIH